MVLHTRREKYKTLSVLFIVYGDCDGSVPVPFNFCSQYLKVFKNGYFYSHTSEEHYFGSFPYFVSFFASYIHTFLSQVHHIPERILLTEKPGPISPPPLKSTLSPPIHTQLFTYLHKYQYLVKIHYFDILITDKYFLKNEIPLNYQENTQNITCIKICL